MEVMLPIEFGPSSCSDPDSYVLTTHDSPTPQHELR